uniref:Uncharacterized protein n=2 Tax=Vibrio TaxID=662 RepID=A0A0H3ZT05_9VIBR|nr:hypothetical protein [Vibrio cyclitrophicus]AKN38262.1 hypothetical protein [Vibrio splendidus]
MTFGLIPSRKHDNHQRGVENVRKPQLLVTLPIIPKRSYQENK